MQKQVRTWDQKRPEMASSWQLSNRLKPNGRACSKHSVDMLSRKRDVPGAASAREDLQVCTGEAGDCCLCDKPLDII